MVLGNLTAPVAWGGRGVTFCRGSQEESDPLGMSDEDNVKVESDDEAASILVGVKEEHDADVKQVRHQNHLSKTTQNKNTILLPPHKHHATPHFSTVNLVGAAAFMCMHGTNPTLDMPGGWRRDG